MAHDTHHRGPTGAMAAAMLTLAHEPCGMQACSNIRGGCEVPGLQSTQPTVGAAAAFRRGTAQSMRWGTPLCPQGSCRLVAVGSKALLSVAGLVLQTFGTYCPLRKIKWLLCKFVTSSVPSTRTINGSPRDACPAVSCQAQRSFVGRIGTRPFRVSQLEQGEARDGHWGAAHHRIFARQGAKVPTRWPIRWEVRPHPTRESDFPGTQVPSGASSAVVQPKGAVRLVAKVVARPGDLSGDFGRPADGEEAACAGAATRTAVVLADV